MGKTHLVSVAFLCRLLPCANRSSDCKRLVWGGLIIRNFRSFLASYTQRWHTIKFILSLFLSRVCARHHDMTCALGCARLFWNLQNEKISVELNRFGMGQTIIVLIVFNMAFIFSSILFCSKITHALWNFGLDAEIALFIGVKSLPSKSLVCLLPG